jgi:hypothetical protein
MEYLAPLIQTILWVILIIGILWHFHNPIYGILTALQKRIESGSNIKAGPFVLYDQLKPQDPIKQKEKSAIEIQETFKQLSSDKKLSLPSSASRNMAIIQERYFQAEDLALRALQVEYGATISRQVTAGADMGFDGAFVINGRLNIVEVKYVKKLGNISGFRITLEKLSNAIANYGWHNVQVILAIVFEKTDDIYRANKQLIEIVNGLALPVSIRCYSFTELQLKFDSANKNSD